MPDKPNRRERRRVSQRTGRRPQQQSRRPQPAPPVSPERVRRPADEELEVTSRPPEEAAPERDTRPEPAVAQQSRPGPSAARPQRPRAMPPSRVLEFQREERKQREMVRDLRQVGITAGITLAVFVAAAFLLQ